MVFEPQKLGARRVAPFEQIPLSQYRRARVNYSGSDLKMIGKISLMNDLLKDLE